MRYFPLVLRGSLPVFLITTLVALAWIIYLPGLSGSFLFDDFVNLPELGAYGPVNDSASFWRYITSGTADPTGRPLSLLTFLLDARNWPADPASFKRTNLLIHLLNGILLFVLLHGWTKQRIRSSTRTAIAATLGAGLWLLHPLLVSTTLYIVQREAMLPATFVLVGLIGYTLGYQHMAAGNVRGLWIAALSVAICTLCATLCKANGALLPALTWLADRMILAPLQPLPKSLECHARRVRAYVLGAPTLLLAAYLGSILWKGIIYGAPPHRPWTTVERLLTEARIFFDYLRLLWVPQPYTGGLFNDHFVISTLLTSPPTTTLSLGVLALLVAACLVFRKRLGAWAAAFLFFFIAHIMETGVLLLELYYEHRNYLPSLLMFWPLSLWLLGSDHTGRDHQARKLLRIIQAVLVVALPLLLAFLTWLRASLWGDPLAQARLWARLSPASPRAQAYAAQMELGTGNVSRAIRQLQTLLAQRPDEIQLALNLIGAKCLAGGISRADLDSAAEALRTTTVLQRMGYEWLQRAIPMARTGACPGLELRDLSMLIDAARTNPRIQGIPGRRQDLDSAAGQVAIQQQRPDEALRYFNRAYNADPRDGVALAQASMLASAGFFDQALAHLEHTYPSTVVPRLSAARSMTAIHRWVLHRQGYWQHERSRLIELIRQDQQEHQKSAI